ncbi:MAG: HAD family phosphatase [Firmicutes bacterium]|nr:HAD family phosphatase [Bacillota bacterium]
MNIIFDIGNVLLTFRPREYLSSLSLDEEHIDLYAKMIFGSSLWLDLDRGIANEQEVITRLTATYPEHTAGIRRIFANWYAMFSPVEESIELLHTLKAEGYRLYALSNFHREAFHYVRSKYAWFDLFDGMVISYEINAIKPEPEIYQALIDQYGLAPQESVFIDDVRANLVGAQALGFHTIHFSSTGELIQELFRLLR